MLRDGEVTFILITPRIDDLDPIEFGFNHTFDVLPVNLVVFKVSVISVLSTKVYDFGILKIGRFENYAALIVSLEFLVVIFDLVLILVRLFWLRFDCDISDGLASDEFLDRVLQQVHVGVVGVRNLRLDDEQLDDVVAFDLHSGEHASDERLYISHTVLLRKGRENLIKLVEVRSEKAKLTLTIKPCHLGSPFVKREFSFRID